MLLSPGVDLNRLPSFRNHEHTASVSLFKQAAECCGLSHVFLNPGTSEREKVSCPPEIPH
eukprot:894143-Pelagomonas_calceolata.AAC.4